MKQLILTLIICTITGTVANAQAGGAETLSLKIAQKMKDSLSLSPVQKDQVYTINLDLHTRKSGVWQQFAGSDSLIRVHVQRIENTRDSLYRTVLTEPQFILYKEKKRRLVNNN